MTAALANQPVVDFTPPNYGLFPPAHYITSPGLIAADVRDHNTVYVPPSTSTTTPTTATTKPGKPGKTTPTTAPPKTTPTTKPGHHG
jgi:hypothetical protein